MNFYPRRRRKPEVIIISLIDIFAILLIFVIVSTTFRQDQPAVTIKLPESRTAVAAEKADQAVRLSITEKQEIFLGAKQVTLDELRGEIQKMLNAPEPMQLALNPDRKASIETLIKVLDVLKEAGVKGNLAAFTESPSK